ncbi:MAG: hypothetical protein ABR501_08755 [Pyrinomonadaceae bacterium]
MRRIFVSSAVVIIALIVIIVTIFVGRSRAVAPSRLNTKDLPRHSLRLIGPTHPEFQQIRDSLHRPKGQLFAERFQQPYVFLKNTGTKRVVAYSLKWELLRDDGRVITKVNSYSRLNVLKGKEASDTENAVILKPKGSRVFSPYPYGDGQPVGSDSAASQGPTDDQLLQQLDQSSVVTQARDELSRITSITVSIDGAFFDDGTFVGPNDTKYFEQVRGQLDAKHDLLQAIIKRLREGMKPNEIMTYLEQSSVSLHAPEEPPLLDPKPAHIYNYYRKMYQDQILEMRKGANGDDELTLRRVFALDEPKRFLKLKKLD